jgi:UDP-N-acetylmuramoyl-tripeptide--D-alanyl-D-alanine ligase
MIEDQILGEFLKCRKICTDTRKVESGAIFFALKGDHFNGNKFAAQALDQGCSMAIVDEDTGLKDDRIILVKDVLTSLQNLAHMYRRTFDIPVLAITGSNGKTTTKELVRDVLKKKYRVHATHGNLNNHIGVPLTLLSIPGDCEFVIVEMGANHRGEIAALCEIAEPGYGVITNVGKAHLEGFGGIEGVKKGKKELYDYLDRNSGKIFVNHDLPLLVEMSNGMQTLPYSAICEQFEVTLLERSPVIKFRLVSDRFDSGPVTSHFAGEYNMFNIATAVAIGLHFSVSPDYVVDAIQAYIPGNNRSQLVKTNKNLLIMDAYNANPTSLENALRGLRNQDHPKKMFIMGDMLELGPEGVNEHRMILRLAQDLGLQGITVGPIFKSLSGEFPFKSFSNNNEARIYLDEEKPSDFLVLVKGSRGIKLEELVHSL